MGFYIDMIDVGQGDSFLLTIDDHVGEYKILIDGGVSSKGQKVVDFINSYADGHLNAVIGTHLDNDHIGGLIDVVQYCDIDNFYLNFPHDLNAVIISLKYQRQVEHKKIAPQWGSIEESLETSTSLLRAMQSKGLEAQPIFAGNSCVIGNVLLNVLNPTQERLDDAWSELVNEEDTDTGSQGDLYDALYRALGLEKPLPTSYMNNAGVVLEVVYDGSPYALFTADVGADVLKEVTDGKRYNFLKVPHHGSKTGLDEILISQIRPSTAYIPVGDNPHGHPSLEVLELLRKYGAKTFCSQKTKDCRKDCPAGGFGNMCHANDKEFRDGWQSIDPSKCINNK